MAQIYEFKFPLTHGLHARPASLFQEKAERFDSMITWINERNGSSADGKSTLALVASDTLFNDPCRIEVNGADEKVALSALIILLEGEFLHVDDDLPEPQVSISEYVPRIIRNENAIVFHGKPISSGIAIGPAAYLEEAIEVKPLLIDFKGEENECIALQRSIDALEYDWNVCIAASRSQTERNIIKVHLALLKGKGFATIINQIIKKNKIPAVLAVKQAADQYAAILQRSQSDYLKERITDIRDVARRLSEHLGGILKTANRMELEFPAICFASTLTPAQLISMNKNKIKGLVLGRLGASSHTAILLRAYGIPCMSGVVDAKERISCGTEVLVDGNRGLAIPAPSQAVKRYFEIEQNSYARLKQKYSHCSNATAQTADSCRIEISANVGSEAEVEAALAHGAESIGVFRTEFIFMDKEIPPAEEEQFECYRRTAVAFEEKPVIMRLLDIGGDKPIAYLKLPKEQNPFLGKRAVRMYPDHEELIKSQIRAVLRASVHGNLRIMIPMISHAGEIRYVKKLIAAVASELDKQGIPYKHELQVGIMVEVPSAVFSLDQLAADADFFSIGSNDLAQYFFAVDRDEKEVAHISNPLEPSFLRLLYKIASDLKKDRKWFGVCGEIAGQKKFLPLLVGLRLNELSMSSPVIPEIKTILSQLDSGECQQLLESALRCEDAAAVEKLLDDFSVRKQTDTVIDKELICIDSENETRDEAIKELLGMLMVAGRIDDMDAVEDAIWQREDVYSTGVGFGTAIPHCKSSAVRATSIAFLKLRKAIPWHAVDDQPVDMVFMIAVRPGSLENQHLKLIARLSRTLMHEEFRDALRTAQDSHAILNLILSALKDE